MAPQKGTVVSRNPEYQTDIRAGGPGYKLEFTHLNLGEVSILNPRSVAVEGIATILLQAPCNYYHPAACPIVLLSTTSLVPAVKRGILSCCLRPLVRARRSNAAWPLKSSWSWFGDVNAQRCNSHACKNN